MASLFDIPIEELKFVGLKRGKLYRKLGVSTIGDLIRFYPRGYEDWSNISDVFSAVSGETYCFKLNIIGDVSQSRTLSGKLVTSCFAGDDTGVIKLIFFNNKYIKEKLEKGGEYYVFGKVTFGLREKEILSPTLSPLSEKVGLHPIYPLTNGLTVKIIQNNVKTALSMLPDKIHDPIPQKYREKYDLIDLKKALYSIHFPDDIADMENARKRLVFEELLILSLGLKSIRTKKSKNSSYIIENDFSKEYADKLPFDLTNAQNRVISQCISDMKNGKNTMNRLLQGDVGSGKTAVAASLCYTVIKNGFQCAFMAPTEILASQHYNTLSKQFDKMGINIALLTGSMGTKEKNFVKEGLLSGSVDLVIGTHALLSENVEFSKLALIITDEQHRFGVSQRSALLDKGSEAHLLVMSATPIPRTLSLIIYGDLDISILDEMPVGRQVVDTFYINSSIRQRVFYFMKKHIDEGKQCYIVCPAIEENTDGTPNIAYADEYAKKIALNDFKGYKVALLHGRMKGREKEAIMNSFVLGEIDVLVSTTVIEVGVDVKNACVMLIENAERFGLSQLHQLRGRVGRGDCKSYCILLSDTKGEEAKARLKVMCSTNNGFDIAEEDLRQRGPGDFFGSRQHGLPELRIASLSDMETTEKTRLVSEEICSHGLHLPEYSALRAEIRRLFGRTGDRLN